MHNLKDLPNFRISRSIEKKVQEIVLSNLGLNSLNKLRDKFEGMAFYNRIRDYIYSIIAVENFFNVKLLDWDNLKKGNLDNLPVLHFNSKTFRIINARVGEPFFIPLETSEDYLLFSYSTNSEYVYLAGYLPSKPAHVYKSFINKNISPIKLRTFQGSIDNIAVLLNVNDIRLS